MIKHISSHLIKYPHLFCFYQFHLVFLLLFIYQMFVLLLKVCWIARNILWRLSCVKVAVEIKCVFLWENKFLRGTWWRQKQPTLELVYASVEQVLWDVHWWLKQFSDHLWNQLLWWHRHLQHSGQMTFMNLCRE